MLSYVVHCSTSCLSNRTNHDAFIQNTNRFLQLLSALELHTGTHVATKSSLHNSQMEVVTT